MTEFEDNPFMHHLIHEEEDISLVFGILDVHGIKVLKIGKFQEEGLHFTVDSSDDVAMYSPGPSPFQTPPVSHPYELMMSIKEDTM
jgi:hypothetical protein